MSQELKREIGLFGIVAYGVGIILGAGIYALIGPAAGMAGNALWASFLVAAIIASFTGLSYAELTSLFPKDASEYVYVKEAFNKSSIAFVIGWLTIFLGIVSSATVALGFAGYFISLFNIGLVLTAIILVVVLSWISFYGIKQSIKLNIIFTLVEFFGLILLIYLSLPFIGNVDYMQTANGVSGIFFAAALIFFAYIGFDAIVKMSEETKNPTKTLPKALIISIIITTILYILVGVAVVSVVPFAELGVSEAPAALVAARATTTNSAQWSLLLTIIALFATFNTVLIMLIATSRMIYGMAKEKCLPVFLSKVHSIRKTPVTAILITMILTMLFVLIGDLTTVANITNFGAFVLFAFVNLSLIWLRYKQPDLNRPFRAPVNIGNFPLLAFLGLLSCIFMLLQFSVFVVLTSLSIIFIGYIVYRIIGKKLCW